MAARFHAVIFDNDGLLLDTEAAWTRAEANLFARRGRVFGVENKRALIGTSTTTSALRVGALELVDALRAAGVPLAVASNSRREFVERVLGSAGLLNGRFDAVVTADDVAEPKPAPDLYLYACSALGAAPERSAALEDSPVGVASALAAGLYVVAVPYFADTRIEGASLTARTLADPEVAASLASREYAPLAGPASRVPAI